jgi:hypothetical protein
MILKDGLVSVASSRTLRACDVSTFPTVIWSNKDHDYPFKSATPASEKRQQFAKRFFNCTNTALPGLFLTLSKAPTTLNSIDGSVPI